MTRDPLDGVALLIPARFHRDRRRLAGQLMAELSASVDALPTTASSAELADLDEAKLWAGAVIAALPTRKGGTHDGNR